MPDHGLPGCRSKAKTGCRTCKIRRVKCDETRPACQRCVSTGRKCDGYGIWTHRLNRQAQPHDGRLVLKPNPVDWCPSPILFETPNGAERLYFDWFRSCAVKKVPGPFDHGSWEQCVLQMSSAEPAVMHALLALASAHKRDSFDADRGQVDRAPDDDERFILRHYTAAIRRLGPHFTSKDTTSIRVTIATCIIFISLEYIRGRYQTGNQHLHNGMRMLGFLTGSSQAIDLTASRHSMDIWLMETLAKMNLQGRLLGQGLNSHVRASQVFDATQLPVIFQSITEARKQLDWMQSEILQITHQWECYCRGSSCAVTPPTDFLDRQRRILDRLAQWDRVYKVSRVTLIAQLGYVGPLVYRILRTYLIMARISAAACFRPHGEMTFDQYTEDFIQLVEEAIDLCKTSFTTTSNESRFYCEKHLSRFITDKGWIPPLYFTAIKCRIHRVRLQAIRLLAVASSKEGVWDDRLASAVATEVMRLEEGELYNGTSINDDFPWDSLPSPENLATLPSISEAHRIRDVELVLPNSHQGPTTLVCKWSAGALSAETRRVFNPVSNTWHDIKTST